MIDRAAIVTLIAQQRHEQGLPPRVSDPVALRLIAHLTATSPNSQRAQTPPKSERKSKVVTEAMSQENREV